MKKLALFLLTLLVALGIGHERARAQVMLHVPLMIAGTATFDPAEKHDPARWGSLGNVVAEVGTETWTWAAPEPSVWLVTRGDVVVHVKTPRVLKLTIEDGVEPQGCGAGLPEPPAGATTWAVYNARPGEVPDLVGVRYVGKDGTEAWYVSDDYVYAGDGDTGVIVVRDPGAERDTGWTHYIGVH